MSIKKILAWTAVAGIAAAAAFYFEGGARLLHNDGASARAPSGATSADGKIAVRALAVSVVRARTADITETLLVTGSLVAREDVLMAPQVEGLRVETLKVEEGTRVAKGDVLATLTSDTLDAQIAQNEASLARSRAAIAQALAMITQAEARVTEASNAFDRARPLNNSGYLSGATLDQRQSAARIAEAQLGASRDGLKVAEAERGVIEAQRRELDWKRARTEIRSPVDGIVSRRTARVGAIATAVGEPMFRIVANGDIELEAEIVDTALARIKVGQTAIVEPSGGEPVTGTVRLVPSEVDKATRLGRARINIGDNPALRVGSFARARIEIGSTRAVAVPASALLYRRHETTLQLVVGDRIETRRVETGLQSGGSIAITSGLAEGDVVVEKSGTFLRDGDIVSPMFASDKLSAAAGRTAPDHAAPGDAAAVGTVQPAANTDGAAQPPPSPAQAPPANAREVAR